MGDQGVGGRARLPAGLGRWGMEELIEPRVRALVMSYLRTVGRPLESLVWCDGEAAGRGLDVLALVLLVESEFSLTIPESSLCRVDSYRALVDVVLRRLVARDATPAERGDGVAVRTVVRADTDSGGGVVRAGLLTAYLAQTIMDDVCASRDAHLDVTVADGTTDADMAAVRVRFAGLAARGVGLAVRRGGEPSATRGAVPPAGGDHCAV